MPIPAPAGQPASPALDDDAEPRVGLIAHCHSPFGDDETFERQRQAVRRVLTFDGNHTWYGDLPVSVSANLSDWQAVLAAAEAGASVEIQMPK
jgi:hypothetical protein